MTRVAWLDASSGISGDMLLGACVDAGVPLEVPQRAIDQLGLDEQVVLTREEVQRAGLRAAWVRPVVPPSDNARGLGDIVALLDRLEGPVRETATATFVALAEAEAQVHGTELDAVHFHEVGALDSIADVVGVAACVHWLAPDRIVCSAVALGGGRARTAHGSIPVPSPAVTELLRRHGGPAYGGPLDMELATPTGVALALTVADDFGPMPALVPSATGSGAGSRDPHGHPNLLRLIIGDELSPSSPRLPTEPASLLQANVDDLDPRLWPEILSVLLGAGADDAWLTPIVMKKGRPAHTVSVLCPPQRADVLARALLTHTSTIGLRRSQLEKTALQRETAVVEVHGAPVRVKVARLDGEVVNVNPEYDDVAQVAAESGIPAKVVLADAIRAAAALWHDTAAVSSEIQAGPQARERASRKTK